MDNKYVPVQESPELLHSFNGSEAQCMSKSTFIMALVFVILLGITSGYVVVSNSTSSPSSPQASNITSSSQISKGIVVGSNDAKTFKDSTEGVLKNGGIDGEGQRSEEHTSELQSQSNLVCRLLLAKTKI